MNTITAKELRDNLDRVVKRVGRGESIRVTYRSKSAFILQPDDSLDNLEKSGSKAAMIEYISQVRAINKNSRQSKLNPSKSIKENYHEMLSDDLKYKGNYGS